VAEGILPEPALTARDRINGGRGASIIRSKKPNMKKNLVPCTIPSVVHGFTRLGTLAGPPGMARRATARARC
jgi:hypothetical protein